MLTYDVYAPLPHHPKPCSETRSKRPIQILGDWLRRLQITQRLALGGDPQVLNGFPHEPRVIRSRDAQMCGLGTGSQNVAAKARKF